MTFEGDTLDRRRNRADQRLVVMMTKPEKEHVRHEAYKFHLTVSSYVRMKLA